jgi:glycosyltransferase involved in cell wall biosynthesis
MTFNVCLINNYNNAAYLQECLTSVLDQSIPFDQIIVVDDGSTDNSLAILNSIKGGVKNFLILNKENGGQVSTLNFARDHIPEKCQVFFLDADDFYPHDYLENVLKLTQFKPWDFAFCEHHIFDSEKSLPLACCKRSDEESIFIQITSAITRSRQCWIGNLTSTLSISGAVFRKIFPYPYIRNETLFADDILIFASSILGFSKIYLPSIAINWRSHENNNSKKYYSDVQIFERNKSISRLFSFYCNQYGIDRYPSYAQISTELQLICPRYLTKLQLPSKLKIYNRLLRQKISNLFL